MKWRWPTQKKLIQNEEEGEERRIEGRREEGGRRAEGEERRKGEGKNEG
jgi:hypothetical protein